MTLFPLLRFPISLVAVLLLFTMNMQAQSVGAGSVLPQVCTAGDLFTTTTNPALNICTATNTWSAVPFGLPSGSVVLISSGTCPTGYSEATDLDGVMLRGTLAAHGNIGQGGGADTITPTVASLTAAAQTFAGSSATSSAVSAGTPAGSNTSGAFAEGAISWPLGVPTHSGITINAVATTSGSFKGTSAGGFSAVGGAAPGSSFTPTINSQGTIAWPAGVPTISAGVFTQPTFAGNALGTHTHTLTATGTNGTSAVSGTLNSFDNRPVYLNVIFCRRN